MTSGRILIVEDEPLISMFLTESLEDAGFQVEEAESATKAMAKLDACHDLIDAAIIDIGLPDRPGDVLCGEIRTKWTFLPIVIASGRDRSELVRMFSGDVKIAVIGKPYTMEVLLEALSQVGVPRTRSELKK